MNMHDTPKPRATIGSCARLAVLTLAATALAACGDAGDGARGDGGDGGPGVGQGGAQDFGQFRQILEDGDIPGPDTIDDVGFFNEHKIDLPPPSCTRDVCLHGELGVMGNMISGSNCTLVMLGMNTPIDIDEVERPPLNLAIAIDTSGSMQGDSIAYVREGLFRMLDALEPEDRITLVTFDDGATIQAEHVPGDATELAIAFDQLRADGSTNIYDGLRTAYEAVADHAEAGLQNRVILLSDGMATAGITSDDKIAKMSAGYNTDGYGLTTIGMGTEFDPTLMRELSESGAGAFYFLEDPSAVQEVFEEEVQAFLVPLAEDVTIDVDIDAGYSLRDIYGTKLFELTDNSGRIEIPSLQLAHRVSDTDNTEGRRGGGGAIVAELLPDADGGSAGTVGTLSMTFRVPGTDEYVNQQILIDSPLAPGETPDDGLFTENSVEKSFVMLNIFVGFEMAATRAAVGDDRGALGVLVPLEESVRDWVEATPDADIEDDLRYIVMFINNLRSRGAENPPPDKNPPEPWPRD